MKTMKTMLAIVLSLVLCTVMLSACASSQTPSGSDPTTTTTTETTTTTTEAVTTTTEATTTTTAAPTIAVNREWLSEIGVTFAELKEKHGEMTAMWYGHGGPIVELADGSGKYSFEGGFKALNYESIPNTSEIPRGERGELLIDPFPQPNPEAVIRTIEGMEASDLFLGLNQNVTAEQLADMYDLENIRTTPAQMHIDGYDSCSFTFESFRISVRTGEDFIITPDAIIIQIEKID